MKKSLLKRDHLEADRLHEVIEKTIEAVQAMPGYANWDCRIIGTWLWIKAPGVKYKDSTDLAFNALGFSFCKSKSRYFLPGLPSKGGKHQSWDSIRRYYGDHTIHTPERSEAEKQALTARKNAYYKEKAAEYSQVLGAPSAPRDAAVAMLEREAAEEINVDTFWNEVA